ncbi:hypothetical protein CF319_g7083 [Tilletia indica]|nr:hypothetical protein CF319_g7083 [Tilletia indica]
MQSPRNDTTHDSAEPLFLQFHDDDLDDEEAEGGAETNVAPLPGQLQPDPHEDGMSDIDVEQGCGEDDINSDLWGSGGHVSHDGSDSDVQIVDVHPGIAARQSTTAPRLHPMWIKGPLQPLLSSVVTNRQNVLVTGPAGSGKTSLLKTLMTELQLAARGEEDAIFALAPTAAAAQIIGGSTIYAWSGVDFGLDNQDDQAESVFKKKGVKSRWRRAKALFFDEISQIDGRLFTLLDGIGRRLRKKLDVPFGGIQQLPGETAFFEALDVVEDVEASVLERFPVPARIGFRVNASVMLRKTAVIRKKAKSQPTPMTLRNGQLGKIYGFATLQGWRKWITAVSRSGSAVILAQIGHSHQASIGDQPVRWPIVRFPSNDGGPDVLALVGFETWQWEGTTAGSTFAARVQIPLTLAWASTIHRAQGQTMEAVRVDVRRAFECGQVYVALSRVASADRIQVIGFSRTRVSADIKVVEYTDPAAVEVGSDRPQKWSDGQVTAVLERANAYDGNLLPLYRAPMIPFSIPKKRSSSGVLSDDVRERLKAKVKHGRSK